MRHWRSGASHQAPTSFPLSPQRLEEELRLHKCTTRECIEQYYLDKLKQVCGPGVGTWLRPGAPELGSAARGPFCRGPWSRTGLGA